MMYIIKKYVGVRIVHFKIKDLDCCYIKVSGWLDMLGPRLSGEFKKKES